MDNQREVIFAEGGYLRQKKNIEQTRSGMRGKKKQDEKEKKGRPWTMDGRQLGKKKGDLMN